VIPYNGHMTAKLLLASALVLGLSSPALVSLAQERNSPDWRRPCLAPIKYRIGSLDPRFGITREDFAQHVEEAAELWGTAAGRKLFSADDRGALEIDLVYDSRQESTQRLIAARSGIAEKLKAGDAIKDELLPLRSRVKALEDSYASQGSSYQRALAAYNKTVTEWNANGGVPEGEQQRLSTERLALRKQEAWLRATRQELNLLISEVNERIRKHNALMDRANAEANALGKSGSFGIGFEEGRYTRQAGEEKIHIFEYDGETALVAILAHEMGHALGIKHNANPASIMSPLVHTRRLVLTDDDRDGLRAACSPRSSPH
jgi:hypothetical protein